jgi:large subunit ribosomal protein L18
MSIHQVVLYRRKREGRTNYKKRLVYLKSNKPRLVVRKTNKQVILQLVNYEPDGDKVLMTVPSSSLKKLGWNYSCGNLPAFYLAGYALGKKAKQLKVNEAIVDFGLHTHVPRIQDLRSCQGSCGRRSQDTHIR